MYPKDIANSLIGVKIKSIEYIEEDQFPCIILENGIQLVISCDPEGNGPGFVSIENETQSIGGI
jgi:hypothetical protein